MKSHARVVVVGGGIMGVGLLYHLALEGWSDIVLVAELTGHARLETIRRYSLPSEKDKEQAVAKLLVDH